MALTPEEQKRLEQLEALGPSTSSKLTPAEEKRMQDLEAGAALSGDDEIAAREARIFEDTRKGGLSFLEQNRMQELEQKGRQSSYAQAIDGTGDFLKDVFFDQPAEKLNQATQDARARITENLESDNILYKAFGVLDAALTPVTIPVDALVGLAFKQAATDTFGLSEETAEMIRQYTNFTAELLTGTAEKKLIDGIFKGAFKDGKTAGPFDISKVNPTGDFARKSPKEKMTRAKRVSQVVDPESPIGKLSTKMANKLDAEDGFKVVLDEETNQGIIDSVVAGANGQYDESKRVMESVADNIMNGQFDPTKIPGVLAKHNLEPTELAILMKEAGSFSGRTLQQWSVAAKTLRHVFKDNPEVLKILDGFKEVEKAETLAGKGFRMMMQATNAWRALLVSQPATAARNFLTQMGRITIASLDEALQPLFKGENVKEGMSESMNGLNHLTSIYSRTNKEGRSILAKVFNTPRGAIAEGKLLGQPVHEVAGINRLIKGANFLNRTQEFFTRKVAFEASLRSQLKLAGKNFNTIDPQTIPTKVYENAVEHALRMSMAADAKSEIINRFIRTWASNPATAGVIPFPRFAFGNLLPFMLEHSPLGYLSAMSPKTLAKVAKGDSVEFASAASKATLGTLGLAAAINLRTDPDLAGEEWYQIKSGPNKNQRADQRAFAPFALYLLEAELIMAPHNVDFQDLVGGFVGLSRPAGNALILGDLLRGKNADDKWRITTRMIGQFVAGYSTFFRGFKDLNTLRDPEQSLARDTRSENILQNLVNPTVNNFPFIDKFLPENYTILREGAVRYEAPSNIPGTGIEVGKEGNTFMRQVTGRTSKTPTELEKKVVEVQLQPRYYSARTGIAEADREIHKIGGPLAKAGYANLKKQFIFDPKMHDAWREDGLSEDTIRFIQARAIGEMMSAVKKIAYKQMQVTRPDLYEKVLEKRAFGGLDGEVLKSVLRDRSADLRRKGGPAPQPVAQPPAVQPVVRPPAAPALGSPLSGAPTGMGPSQITQPPGLGFSGF